MISRFLVTAALLLAVPSAASAHGIGVEAKLKGHRVAVEAFFDDDTPAADAKVAVTAQDGKVIAEGKTDAKGTWSFPAPAPGKYKVAVDAGGGHLAKTTLTIPPGVTPNLPETSAPAELEVIVSDGPTRAESTGPRRALMAVVGVAVIGLLTWGVRFATRRKANRQATGAAPRPASASGLRFSSLWSWRPARKRPTSPRPIPLSAG